MYLNILKESLKEYKSWLNSLDFNLKSIETSIFQNDNRNILIEKLTSFGLSAIVMHIIFGFFTGGISIIFMLVSGFLSWLASKLTFNFLFGKARTKKDLLESELIVIEKIKDLENFIDLEKIKLLKKESMIYFEYYQRKKDMFNELNKNLKNMDQSKLSKAYKIKLNNAIFNYDKCIFNFDIVYT